VKEQYLNNLNARKEQNLPPLPLDESQTKVVVENLLKDNDSDFYLDLLTNRVPSGVDIAAKVKADFLYRVASETQKCASISPELAIKLLGTMLGGYNVDYLIDLLDGKFAKNSADALSKTLLVYDGYNKILELSKTNEFAKSIVESWASAQWFLNKSPVPKEIKLTVFKVDGETNTDDLSPAKEAWSRPDIPLHANSMLNAKMDKPLEKIAELKKLGNPLAYVGDVVGTGSSRKSAINSILWHMGEDIDYLPNKRTGGVVLGGKIAPIFFNTAQDSGVLPIECDVSNLKMGDEIIIYPYDGEIKCGGEVVATFEITPNTLFDEVRAGGRIPLIIGRGLSDKAKIDLGINSKDEFVRPQNPENHNGGWTLAQKMVGRACGVEGIAPHTYCEPKMSSVGSQDTTGAMTRDELKELACLGFNADLVMQSFCHTAAYPKDVDLKLQKTLPDFMENRGGVSLKPGDGVIHSWLNRMLLPDEVGTGGDSHTRFPLGISFPAGSGLVAFGATLGVLPLNMPESVLVRFKGEMQDGITLRDLVNAIPYIAIQKGLLTVEKAGKKNVFSGRVLEIEGLENLPNGFSVEQAFELADASAERSANGCTVKLSEAEVSKYLKSNVELLKSMVASDYEDKITLNRRIEKMQDWLDSPNLLEADKDAEYAEIIEIDLSEIKEPILACPNDPDDVKTLSEITVMGEVKVDEVFIGSCMTNIGHFRAATQILANAENLPTELWIAPPTKMDEKQLKFEGSYKIFEKLTSHTETPGCSLCMGNQARVANNATVVSTSTRNFPNRLGDGANVYLASAELSAITAKLGKLPTVSEYQELVRGVDNSAYKYLSFDDKTAGNIDIKTVV
jgi:aconitate hydratase 2/2-methylisocitrate dehydratase